MRAGSLSTRVGLQARIGGNMLGSRPSLVNVPMQLPGSWQHPSSETGTIGLGDDRVQLVQSGHTFLASWVQRRVARPVLRALDGNGFQ